ncbi:MAG: ABC transporter substrate-binding protein [Lachnospiraceae bacterium]|nr:ABC transporter substrate-binding protein [Lachnospiraceae bacterium]
MRRNKNVILLLLAALILPAGCGEKKEPEGKILDVKSTVSIEVSTIYAGDDVNAPKFEKAKSDWEKATGYMVIDSSGEQDQSYAARIMMDFQAGAEPDVLMFSTGDDSLPFVKSRRVVSLNEIREEYPEYGANMQPNFLKKSSYDGREYALTVSGYWEGLVVNKSLCEYLEIEVPGRETTWEEFEESCNQIRSAGFVPIAASLVEKPDYIFEYCTYNFQSVDTHEKIPKYPGDKEFEAWLGGIATMKHMYKYRFFPSDTLKMSEREAEKLFLEGKAVFMFGGESLLENIEAGADDPEDYCVTYVPGAGDRRTSDMIAGLSNGYYITRKAWENPDKRKAAVDFVEFMTNDDMLNAFSDISTSALNSVLSAEKGTESRLEKEAKELLNNATGVSSASLDFVPATCKSLLFDYIPEILEGNKFANEAVSEVIKRKERLSGKEKKENRVR